MSDFLVMSDYVGIAVLQAADMVDADHPNQLNEDGDGDQI